jgi:hypothetical protein
MFIGAAGIRSEHSSCFATGCKPAEAGLPNKGCIPKLLVVERDIHADWSADARVRAKSTQPLRAAVTQAVELEGEMSSKASFPGVSFKLTKSMAGESLSINAATGKTHNLSLVIRKPKQSTHGAFQLTSGRTRRR